MMITITKTKKNEFTAKEKSPIFRFLQNINYDKLEKVNFQELNLNYLIHKFLFRRDVKKTNNNSFELELGYIKFPNNNTLEFCDYPPLGQKVPKEIKGYFDTIKNFCNGMDLELITEELNMKIHDKLIIGLGNPSVLETSMTLHHVYGVPYLPGQALKGIFRRYFIDEVMEDTSESKIDLKNGKTIQKEVLYRKLFGEDFQNEGNERIQKSGIVFFDAFPIDEYKIKKDIINTHYRSYYDGNGFPNGTEEPNLVKFYTVKDTEFKILCALNKKEFGDDYSLEFQKHIVNILIEALEEQGIGAKTASGYGYLKLKNKGKIDEEYQEKRNMIRDEKLSRMNKVERKIYELEIDKVTAKTELIATLVKDLKNNNIYSVEEKKELAEYAKKFYENENSWKIKKKKKKNNIIAIICEILDCDLPK